MHSITVRMSRYLVTEKRKVRKDKETNASKLNIVVHIQYCTCVYTVCVGYTANAASISHLSPVTGLGPSTLTVHIWAQSFMCISAF